MSIGFHRHTSSGFDSPTELVDAEARDHIRAMANKMLEYGKGKAN
jgi:hypothetical protein